MGVDFKWNYLGIGYGMRDKWSFIFRLFVRVVGLMLAVEIEIDKIGDRIGWVEGERGNLDMLYLRCL